MSIDRAAASPSTRQTAPVAGVGLGVRPARADEAPLLSELAMRSKGWWGYSASFLKACEAELTLSAEQAAKAVVVEVDGVVAGFHLLAPSTRGSDVGELDMLFVDPVFIGSGIGRILFEDARRAAAARGWSRVQIQADPQARPFYERLGAIQVGERLSRSIPGHSLPLFEITLRGGGTGRPVARATYWR
jgi:GNAT superfamily N-acetyltransferase